MSQAGSNATRRRELAALAESILEPGTKGILPQRCPIALGAIGAQGWSVLRGDVLLPAAVLLRSTLARNSRTMRDYLAAHAMAIAPHGKTTMAPQLFDMQMRDGAWGITVATVQQFAICRRFAFDRVLIANELVGEAEIDYVFGELERAPELELYCLIDSVAGVQRLAEGGKRSRAAMRMNCLVEVGMPGGRAGCRTVDEAVAVARAAAGSGLAVRGVEGFEGILPDAATVDVFLDRLCEVAERIAGAGYFAADRSVVLTAGGSAYYDRVAARLAKGRLLAGKVEIITRSGCYLTHDSGAIADAFSALRTRDATLIEDAFAPALLVFTHVQSRPEPGKAILAMGRRDAGTDAGLPVPLLVYRAGRDARPIPIAGHRVTALNDQHTHLACPEDSDIAVGDIVAFGVSHPCTTFDKWQVLFVVDDDFQVVDAIRTFF